MGVKCCAANSSLPPRRADPHAEGKNPVGEPPPAVGSLQSGPPLPSLPGSSAAQGAGMLTALHVRLCARLARMFPCGEGRAYVFTLRARAGAEGGAVSPRSDAGWSSA